MTNATCRIDGCEKPRARNPSRTVCEMHRYRIIKYGDPNMAGPPGGQRRRPVTVGKRSRQSDGYIRISLPGHPLADSHHQVYEHRKVLFDELGPGDQLCFQCERVVSWFAKGSAQLVVDHIDDNPENNEPANLQPACRTCNAIKHGNWYAQRTHCSNGHEYTVENTHVSTRGARVCRACRRKQAA